MGCCYTCKEKIKEIKTEIDCIITNLSNIKNVILNKKEIIESDGKEDQVQSI